MENHLRQLQHKTILYNNSKWVLLYWNTFSNPPSIISLCINLQNSYLIQTIYLQYTSKYVETINSVEIYPSELAGHCADVHNSYIRCIFQTIHNTRGIGDFIQCNCTATDIACINALIQLILKQNIYIVPNLFYG